MNRITKVALMSVLALASVSIVKAEDGPREGKGPKAWKEKRFEMMKEKLGLSDEKAEKLKAIFENAKKTGKPLRQQLKVSIAKLRWQVEAKADSKDIAATLAEVKKAHKALQEHRESARASAEALLTPEQSARILLAMAHHRRGGPRGHCGGPGQRGGPEGRGAMGPERWHGDAAMTPGDEQDAMLPPSEDAVESDN